MKKIYALLIAALLLCIAPVKAAPDVPPYPEIIWLGGNATGQSAYLTIVRSTLELRTTGSQYTIDSVHILKAPPAQITVYACGHFVYVAASGGGYVEAHNFDTGNLVLPCAPSGLTLWLPYVAQDGR